MPFWRRFGGVLALLVAINALLFALGLGNRRSGARSGKLRVGLVFDVGGLGDKSFNDAAHRGLERAAEELDVEVEFREPANGADRDDFLRRFAAEGTDLVIGVGFIFTDDITKLARERPSTRFACIDYAPQHSQSGELVAADGQPFPPNLVGLTFREEEGSMLVGALAGLTARRGRKVVGFVGGMKIPLIEKFEAGYTQGARRTCPDCRVLSAYAGSEPKAFADPTMGRELAMAQIAAGAEVIFHAAGKTGEGVFQAVREGGRLAIGVDSDQADEAPGHVLTSMVKGVDRAVFEITRDTRDGHFAPGIRQLGLAEDGVGYVYDHKNRDLIGEAARAAVEALRLELIDRRLTAPSRMSEVTR